MKLFYSAKAKKTYIIGITILVFIIALSVVTRVRKTKEPTYMGRPITEWLRNKTVNGTNRLTLDQMLTLKPVITGEEPDIATFELPISYESLKKIGLVFLLVDADTNKATAAGSGEYQECDQATNGNCLLEWNVSYEKPGAHYLQAELFIQGQRSKSDYQKFYGPSLLFCSSNIVQFDPFYSEFDSKGAMLYAKVFQTNATYSIDLRTPSGQRIRTITGSTTNGIVEVFWDLRDDSGRRFTNIDEVRATFHVTNSISRTFSSQKKSIIQHEQ